MVKIKVEVGNVDGICFHSMKEGDYFIIDDYKLKIPDGKHVCIWLLNSLMLFFPLLIEKDRLGEDHWVKDAKSMRCPDGKVSYFFYNV
jgi:uncharacterized repeat protein (TIGR04076 family)